MRSHVGKAGLDDLAAFALVAEAGSFTRAAAGLSMSTSNLSHTIRRLEARLGYRLLQRNSRSVSITEEGRSLLAALRPALDDIDGALESLERGREKVLGTLRLTMTRQAYEAIVRPILPEFCRLYPEATIEVLIDYAYRDIVAEQFDAGIRLGEKLESDMIALKIGRDLSMAIVAAPAYLDLHPPILKPADLIKHRCINYRMLSAGTIYAWEFEKDGKAFEVGVRGPLTFNEPELMLGAALDGLGIGNLLEHEVAGYVASGQLVRILADWTPPFPGFHFYYSSKRQMRPVLVAFINLIRHPVR